jgi:hypothetical protein
MEQLVIVLIIGAVSLIKWLMERSADAQVRRNENAQAERRSASASPYQPPVPVAPSVDAREAARRLREALGLPPDEEQPPPVFRQSPPRREPVILFERSLVESEPANSAAALPSPFLSAAAAAMMPIAMPPAPEPVPAPRPPARAGLDGLLRSREGLRRAILVQEILGTPKGLVF